MVNKLDSFSQKTKQVFNNTTTSIKNKHIKENPLFYA